MSKIELFAIYTYVMDATFAEEQYAEMAGYVPADYKSSGTESAGTDHTIVSFTIFMNSSPVIVSFSMRYEAALCMIFMFSVMIFLAFS